MVGRRRHACHQAKRSFGLGKLSDNTFGEGDIRYLLPRIGKLAVATCTHQAQESVSQVSCHPFVANLLRYQAIRSTRFCLNILALQQFSRSSAVQEIYLKPFCLPSPEEIPS